MQGVINYMEIWVQEYMETLLEKAGVCKCEKCRRDIFTLALNHLKPYYVATPIGEIMVKLESTKQQFDTDIIVEVSNAIKKVAVNPNHDR